MTFLPIVARELRVAARRPGLFRVRSGAPLGLLLLGAGYVLFHRGAQAQELGMGLFCLLTGSAVLYCLLSGVWFTADCLSEEKREGTLGLLFLTDLKGYDVILGKLVASSVSGSYAVLALVPTLALPLLMGGVAAGEFARMALVVVNTLFFSLALGMFASAISRSPRKAIAVTLSLIVFFTAVLPICGAWRAGAAGRLLVERGWLLASAGFSYSRAFDQPYKLASEEFWWSAAVIHGLGWFFLSLASVIVPRSWQDRAAGAPTLRWRERWRRWSYGQRAERAGFRSRLLDRNAYAWLTARARLKPAYVWAALGLVACGWVWGLARFHRDWLDEGTYVLTGIVLNLLLKVWFGLEVGRQLAEDRREGALELLLSTPLTVKEILRGQMLALQRVFLGPVLVVMAVFGLLMIAGASNSTSLQAPQDQTFWGLFWAAGMVLLVADLAGLYWFGMWQALAARNPTRAAAMNLGCILALPWAVGIIGLFVAAFFWRNANDEPALTFLLGCWFGLGMVADLGFGAYARHQLLTQFRLAAARRYEARPGFWKRLLGCRAKVPGPAGNASGTQAC